MKYQLATINRSWDSTLDKNLNVVNGQTYVQTYACKGQPKCPVWSESLLCTLRTAKNPRLLHVDSVDSDQTGWTPRLIWVFAASTCHLLVLSWGGSLMSNKFQFTRTEEPVCISHVVVHVHVLSTDFFFFKLASISNNLWTAMLWYNFTIVFWQAIIMYSSLTDKIIGSLTDKIIDHLNHF